MEFNVAEFLEDPSWEKLDKLKKSELLKMSMHFEAEAKPAMRKQEIKNVVIQTLVDEEVLDESVLEHIIKYRQVQVML